MNHLESRLEVIDFGTNRKRVYIFLFVVNFAPFQRYGGLDVEIDNTPIPANG